MIFQLNDTFVNSIPQEVLSEICTIIIKKGHFLCTDSGGTFQIITNAIEQHAATWDKRLFKNSSKKFNPTKLQRLFYRTYTPNVGDDIEWLKWLAENPGYLILENAHHEWVLYSHIIEIYKHDREYKSLFEELKNAFDTRRIEPRNAGGYTGMIKEKNIITSNPKVGNIYVNLKAMMVFDRDKGNSLEYDDNKNDLFAHLCRKKHTTVTEADIYSLSQSPMAWHMWYKRAIENYFHPEVYEKHNMYPRNNTDDWDYYYVDDKTVKGYQKNQIAQLAVDLGRSYFDRNMKSFYSDVAGKNLTEMQLFLLKLVRIM